MKTLLRSPKFWLLALLLGLLALRAGCPPGIRRALTPTQGANRNAPALPVPRPADAPR